MRRFVLCAVVVLLSCGSVSVAWANTQLGLGLTKCGQYIQLRQQNREFGRAFEAWVLGYLSGVNFVVHTSKGVDLLADQSAEKVSSFVDGYCRARPDKTVTEAANEFWFGLAEKLGR